MKKLVFTAAFVAVICVSANLHAQDRFNPLSEAAATKYQPRVLEIFFVSLYDHFQAPMDAALEHDLAAYPRHQNAVQDDGFTEITELYMHFLVMGYDHEEAIEMLEYVLLAVPDSGPGETMR